MSSIYDNGASFQGGTLKVTNSQVVDNLNADKLHGLDDNDFFRVGSNYGTNQSGKTTTMTGVTHIYDTTSEIKIGNIIIKPSDNGNGILVGI